MWGEGCVCVCVCEIVCEREDEGVRREEGREGLGERRGVRRESEEGGGLKSARRRKTGGVR